MGERARRHERRYENQGYEEVPYAAPLALRAIRGSVVRQRNPVAESADTVIATINDLLDGRGRDKAAPSPPGDAERRVEELVTDETHPAPRRKLGGRAIEAVQDEAA